MWVWCVRVYGFAVCYAVWFCVLIFAVFRCVYFGGLFWQCSVAGSSCFALDVSGCVFLEFGVYLLVWPLAGCGVS